MNETSASRALGAATLQPLGGLRRIGRHLAHLVEGGDYEVIYANVPVTGLARATAHVPATGRRETARRRLGKSP